MAAARTRVSLGIAATVVCLWNTAVLLRSSQEDMKTNDLIMNLSDDELITESKRLAACERRATAALLRCLMELDARRLYLAQGCSSLFAYCTRVLKLSEHAAYGRIEAARAARRFPCILEQLEAGAITLTTISLLAPVVSPSAALAREAASPAPACSTEPRIVEQTPLPNRALVKPLAPTRYIVKLTVSDDTHEKLRRAQSLLRHAVPDGDLAEVLDRALTALLRRCGETAFVEFHHCVPFADGGPPRAANVELRCAAHNAHEADRWFRPMMVREMPAVYACDLRNISAGNGYRSSHLEI